jgi:hypothetical protein
MATSEILQAIGLGTVIIAGLYRWGSSRFRSKLKDDLEILKRYSELSDRGGEPDEYSEALRRSIERGMHRAYRQPPIEVRALVLGLICIVSGILNFVVERPPSILAVIVGTLGLVIGPASIIAALVAPRDW